MCVCVCGLLALMEELNIGVVNIFNYLVLCAFIVFSLLHRI